MFEEPLCGGRGENKKEKRASLLLLLFNTSSVLMGTLKLEQPWPSITRRLSHDHPKVGKSPVDRFQRPRGLTPQPTLVTRWVHAQTHAATHLLLLLSDGARNVALRLHHLLLDL